MNFIRIFGPRDQWGSMSPLYPSPFTLDGQRWRSLEHWVQASRVGDRDVIRTAVSPFQARTLGDQLGEGPVREDILWRGIVAKFNDNPELLSILRSTGKSRIVSNDVLYDRLGPLLERLRDSIALSPEDTRDRDVVIGNLYAQIKDQGYTELSKQRDPWEPRSIDDAPLDDFSLGMIARGPGIEATIDIFLDKNLDRNRVIQMVKEIWDPRPRPARWDPSIKRTYIIVANFERRMLNELLRITAFRDVKIFSPAQLHIRPSQHILSPPIVRIQNLPDGLDTKNIPSISVNDVLIKEKGLRVGDIIEVHDFSPHYRLVV